MSSGDVFEVSPDRANTQKREESNTALSGRSHIQNGTFTRRVSDGVTEYQSLERLVRPRTGISRLPRKSRKSLHKSDEKSDGNSTREVPKAHSPKRRYAETGTTIVRLDDEDPDDPIIDDYHTLEPRVCKNIAQALVAIPSPGTKDPASAAESGSSNEQVQPDGSSKYFSPEGRGTVSMDTVGTSLSVDKSRSRSGQKSLLSPTKSNTHSRKKHTTHSPVTIGDDSMDYLSPRYEKEHEAAREQARGLLERYERSKRNSSKPATRTRQNHDVDLTSEDELQVDTNADIKPSNFVSYKKQKQKQQQSVEDTYDVVEMFSQTQTFLPAADKTVWSLSVDIETVKLDRGELSCINIATKSFRRVVCSIGHPGVNIHVPKGSFGQDSQLFLTFGNADQSMNFARHLESYTALPVIHKSWLVYSFHDVYIIH